MKKLFNIIQAFLFILIISSCSGPKKTSENKNVTSSASQQNDSATKVLELQKKAEQSKPSEPTQTDLNKSAESVTGTEVIEKAISKLNNKLILTDQQVTSITDILKTTFLGSGEDLNKIYTGEQSKTISRDIIQKSSNQISGVLDASQKVKFNAFLHH